MSRILVSPVPESGVKPFEMVGELITANFPQGTVYYMHGMSFPAEIVKVLEA